ncbi:MAG: ATP-dependent DNA helicase RecG [Acetatifactor sp.]|nr:ATP-dependent DNA helicase RecG [Acetatifactor sp.]
MRDNTPLIQLKGVGTKTKGYFDKLEIHTVGDLLTTYPRDYDSFEPPVKIGNLSGGEVACVYAAVTGTVSEKKVRNLSVLTLTVSDGTGLLTLTFFNMPFLKKVLKKGGYYCFRGKVSAHGTKASMEQPAYYSYQDYMELTKSLLPVYSLTKGLTNKTFRKLVEQAMMTCVWEEEFYPPAILDTYHLLPEKEAIRRIHFPEDRECLAEARRRLVFDEFFGFFYFLRQNKKLCEGLKNEYCMFETADTVRFLEQLPFPLTKAQKKVWQDIRNDLGSPYCMNRLVQGDVGSGKTIVAVLALMMTAANGYQGALMAPTEVLAVQHFETIRGYVEKYHVPFRPVLLVGSMTAAMKRQAYEQIASGEANLIIGTHALIQERVVYRSLALVVTDEQHRFGVKQREQLSEKGVSPHILVMSATPIPRTLAIILYGDLQVSVIDELPADRLPIKNCVVGTNYRATAYKFLAGQVAQGRQVYVICPQVEEGELDNLENVVDYTEKLRAALPETVAVSYLHGKMRPADKNRIMEQFADGSIDVLVSTTVIEVGINVPNATVMMVENADRFGLAQLHQLRGRVGRGEHQSYCIFVSSQDRKETMERLEILNRSNDGFFIAAEDLRLRGPGDLFGIRQSGEFAFRMGDIYGDSDVLKEACEAVDRLLVSDPDLETEEMQPLKEHLRYIRANNVDFRSI